jgi:hypothetical protein
VTSASTILDVLEDQTGQRFGEDLIACIKTAPDRELSELAERVTAFRATAPVPAKQHGGELRPYVPVIGRNIREGDHGLNLDRTDFDDPRRAEAAFDSLKHHLLYCHSLAVDDPLGYILDAFATWQPNELWRRDARPRLVNCVHFLERIEPLIRSGAVVLVEDQPWRRGFSRRIVRDLDDLTASADLSDLTGMLRDKLDELEAQGPTAVEVGRQVVLELAEQQLTRGLQAAAAHPGELDLYMPYRHYEAVLQRAAQEALLALPDSPREVELHVLGQLLALPVPGLSQLSVDDLVAVREQDEGFARWRAALERALERVERLDDELLNPQDETLRLIRLELLEQEQALEADIKKSSFLARARVGMKQFGIGSVAAAGLAPVVGPGPAVASGAANAALTLLWDYVRGRGTRERRHALHRQYLVFSPTTPAN